MNFVMNSMQMGGPVMYLLLMVGFVHLVLCAVETVTRGRYRLMPLLIAGIASAVLLGLLGTVQGLVMAFKAVGSASPSLKQQMLAMGISVSLYTSMLGLFVAMVGCWGAGIAGVFRSPEHRR